MLRLTLAAVALLAACQPYNGPPCTTCLGPYDLTLDSHRAALVAGLVAAWARQQETP